MPKYKKITPNIQEVIINNEKHSGELRWVNVNNAGKKEIEYLRKRFGFELKDLQASSSKARAQRSVINKDEKYFFMIINFPVFKGERISSGEVDIFIGHGFMITIHNKNINALNDFFKKFKKDGDAFLSYQLESSAILLYELLDHLTVTRYRILDKISLDMEKLDKIIFEQKQKRAVSQILLLKRNIISARKIIQNHKNIFKKLLEMESKLVPAKNIRTYYSILIENSKRIWEITENQKEMIEVLHDTNESLLNYRISDIMKTLTIFSVIVFPLTLLAAIFGMNTTQGMPFLETENGFWIIIMMMLIGCLGMILYFKKRRWL